jgi:hypothetical protein
MNELQILAILLIGCALLTAPTGLTFDAATHTYTLDGVPVPSVTQILRASGLIDFTGIPESILEAARVRGTTVHQAIAYFNDGDLDLEQFRIDFPDYVGYLEGWLSFCQQRHFVSVLSECRIASRRHQIAGTIDCLGELDGEAVLIDYATGRPQDVAKDLQTAAYLSFALDMSIDADADPRLVDFFKRHALIRRYAVSLNRDGTFGLHRYDDPGDFRKFLALAEAQRIVRARRVEVA